MAKIIPFDIKYRPQIESGEYIVIDRFNYKLHFVKEEDGVFFFTVRYPGCNYDTERLYDHPERNLFIVTPEEEPTDEEKYQRAFNKGYEQAKKETIEKACLWLKTHLCCMGSVEEIDLFNELFEKAMREE